MVGLVISVSLLVPSYFAMSRARGYARDISRSSFEQAVAVVLSTGLLFIGLLVWLAFSVAALAT